MYIRHLFESKTVYTDDEIRQTMKKLNVKYDFKTIKKGVAVELEHGNVNKKTDVVKNDSKGRDDLVSVMKIVIAHLNESDKYYTELEKMERKLDR